MTSKEAFDKIRKFVSEGGGGDWRLNFEVGAVTFGVSILSDKKVCYYYSFCCCTESDDCFEANSYDTIEEMIEEVGYYDGRVKQIHE